MSYVQLPRFQTLTEMITWHLDRWPDKPVFHFLDREHDGVSLSYRTLDRDARAVAARLAAECAPHDRALLLFPPGPELITALLGCVYAEVIAVPAFPPHPARLERTLPRLISIATQATPKIGLTTCDLQPMIAAITSAVPELANVAWIASDAAEPSTFEPREASEDSIALIQYTSGSTSEPKGVVLDHRNLLANLTVIRNAFEANEETRSVFWLPLYHDMGLIGGVFGSLFNATETWLMSPLDFLQRPLRWLEAISRTGADTSGGPNFAYAMCVQKTTPEERAQLDLSRWTLAFNGAESIRAEVLDRFAEAFAPAGFRREAFYPCYGLAESTLMVSGGPRLKSGVPRYFSGAALEAHRVEAAAAQDPGAVRLVPSGRTRPEFEVEIVDGDNLRPMEEGHVGEIWVCGGSVTRSYWANPELSEAALRASLAGSGNDTRAFLRTGDYGFRLGDDLFVTGRKKDLIIHRGRNLYPQDIEAAVEASHPALRSGCSIAIGVERGGEERVVVVAEVHGPRRSTEPAPEAEDITTAVKKALIRHHDLQVDDIVLVARGVIPKTSSGKVQRQSCRATYLQNELPRWRPVRDRGDPPRVR